MFFPYRDDNPRNTFPLMTLLLIAVNTIIFFLTHTSPHFKLIVYTYGFIPNNFSFVTIFTSMFLHQDLFHLISNMWFLWLFGDNVEDKLGKIAFLFYFLAGGISSMLLHSFFIPNIMRNIPSIGASGAVSAIMGTYIILFPHVRIRTFVWLLFFITVIRVNAFLFLALWFFMQLSSATNTSGYVTNIAYWAHIGGFIYGVAIGLLSRFFSLFSRSE